MTPLHWLGVVLDVLSVVGLFTVCSFVWSSCIKPPIKRYLRREFALQAARDKRSARAVASD